MEVAARCGRRGSASARGSNRASPAARRRREISTPLACALPLILSPTSSRPRPQSPVERRDQLAVGVRSASSAAARTGRCALCDDVGAVVLQALEERLPLGVDRRRVGLVAGVEVFDIGGIAAIEETRCGRKPRSRLGETFRSCPRRGMTPRVGRRSRSSRTRDRRPAAWLRSMTSGITDRLTRSQMIQGLNQPFSTSTSVLPSRAGDGETLMPAASIAAILSRRRPCRPR